MGEAHWYIASETQRISQEWKAFPYCHEISKTVSCVLTVMREWERRNKEKLSFLWTSVHNLSNSHI
jgi:hypothetical protein